MVSKLPEIPSPEDPTWLAEVTYRFALTQPIGRSRRMQTLPGDD